MTKDVFVLFPTDMYKDYSYLKGHKVVLVEHTKFFDRSASKYGKMRLNILKPVYHRLTMQEYQKYLKSKKIDVTYVNLKDDWVKKVKSLLSKLSMLRFFDPVDRDLENEIKKSFDPYEIINSPRFILQYEEMEEYNNEKGSLRQTSFYNWMRKKTEILMNKSGNKLKPAGGKLTYDMENRKPPKKGMAKEMDSKTSVIGVKGESDISNKKEVKDAVKYVVDNISESHLYIFDGSYSDLKSNSYDLNSVGIELRFPFDFTTSETRLRDFISKKLDNFGEYQDSIVAPIVGGGDSENSEEDTESEDYDISRLRSLIYHSGISVMMNVGLLTPSQVIDAVLASYKRRSSSSKKSVLNSVEGFIRQILGWREFCRYTYEFESDKYLNKNYFNARKKLGKSWYTGNVGVVPVDDVIEKGFRFGYLHHIERLMVIANYMTLNSIYPGDMFKWFTEFSLDSYDWVMEYNIYAMGSYADGGNFTTKPYVSSSNYIIKISDYPGGKESEDWCNEWDIKFWKFMKKHSAKMKKVNRLGMLVKHADKNIKKLTKN